MKIFPPLSEMLWPPGYSAWQLLRARRTLLLASVVVIGGLLIWPASRSTNTANKGNEALTITGPACNTLVRQHSVAGAATQPCRSFQMTPGASVKTGEALQRSGLPPRPTRLSATDRAIQPPKKDLRTTAWGRSADIPSYESEQPAVAMSPSQYDRR